MDSRLREILREHIAAKFHFLMAGSADEPLPPDGEMCDDCIRDAEKLLAHIEST